MSKAERLSQAERTQLSDARMLASAVSLIVEKGPDLLSLKEVGERAGYSRGLAGYRFGNKAGLFDFVIHAIGEQWLQQLKSVTAGKTGYAAIAAATDAHYLMCKEAPDDLAAFYILWFGAIGPQSDVRSLIASIHERRHKDVLRWIREGIEAGSLSDDVDAEAIAGQFSAAIVGIVYQWLLSPENNVDVKALFDGLKSSTRLALGVTAA